MTFRPVSSSATASCSSPSAIPRRTWAACGSSLAANESPNETFEACLARELREELGIEVTVGELVESITHAYPEKTVHLRFYRCRWERHEPQPLDCPAFKWVSAAELKDYQFPAADARLLDHLRQNPALWRQA